jgi:hypothetical protein
MTAFDALHVLKKDQAAAVVTVENLHSFFQVAFGALPIAYTQLKETANRLGKAPGTTIKPQGTS